MGYEEIGNVKLVTLGGYAKKTKIDHPISLEGYYLRSEQREDSFNKGKMKTLYVFRTSEGDVGTFAPHDLKQKMDAAIPGRMTLVEFTGEKDLGKGNPMKLFKVSQDKSNTLDPEDLAVASQPASEEPEDNSYDSEPVEEAPVRASSPRTAPPTSATSNKVAELLASRNKR